MTEIKENVVEEIKEETVCSRCGGRGMEGTDDIHDSGLCHSCEEDLMSLEQSAVATPEPQKATEDVFKWMDPSNISMRVIPKRVAYELGFKAVFDKGTTQADLENAKDKVTKEPNIQATAKATFNLEMLLNFLKTADKVSGYVTLEMKTDEPIKVSCKTEDRKELRFYLAPYIED